MNPTELFYTSDLTALLGDAPVDSIVSRTFLRGGQNKAILFAFAPGQELSEHTASVPAILHILEGKARLTLGEQTHEAGPGSWAYMPANLPHSIFAHQPVSMLLLMLSGQD
jgi:quercetin dioxygenase-like cupin family protein